MLSIIKYNLCSASLFEFSAHHSTWNPIELLTDLLTLYIEKSEKVAAIFFDLS